MAVTSGELAVTNSDGVSGNPTFGLYTVNASIGSYGDASHSPTVTVDAKGRVTSASSNAIAIATSQVTGATTTGGNILKVADPSAIRFLRVNADNTVTLLSDSDFRTAIGAGAAAGGDGNWQTQETTLTTNRTIASGTCVFISQDLDVSSYLLTIDGRMMVI